MRTYSISCFGPCKALKQQPGVTEWKTPGGSKVLAWTVTRCGRLLGSLGEPFYSSTARFILPETVIHVHTDDAKFRNRDLKQYTIHCLALPSINTHFVPQLQKADY